MCVYVIVYIGGAMNLVETKPSELGEFQYKKYRLTMHLYQGKKIPALDGNGLCDPFVMVHGGPLHKLSDS